MGILFSRKTNKKANNIFQMKNEIRLRAEAIRKQNAQGTHAVHFTQQADSELFRTFGAQVHYETVGKERGYESD